jgi:hypothetical protein
MKQKNKINRSDLKDAQRLLVLTRTDCAKDSGLKCLVMSTEWEKEFLGWVLVTKPRRNSSDLKVGDGDCVSK